MRRLVVAAILSTVFVGTALARPEAQTVRGLCNSASVDLYYWPDGHPAVPAVGFPPFAPAHVELYVARDVTNAGQLAYMDVVRAALSPTRCSALTEKPVAIPARAATRSTVTAQKLRCTLAADAQVRIARWTQVKRRVVVRRKVRRTIRTIVTLGNRGSVGASGALAAVAEVRLSNPPGRSSLRWNARACVTVDVAG